MKAQVPAEGITKTHEWGTSKMYKITCQCGNPDDDIDFEVEADETGVTVTTYNTQKTNFWEEAIPVEYQINDPWYGEIQTVSTNVWNGFVRRCKLTWSIWFKGYVEYQSTTIMTEQQALNYAETLKSAILDVQQLRKEKASK